MASRGKHPGKRSGMNIPRIVVVGGGAGGLELVSHLGRKLGRSGKADVVLVDRNHTHVWKPLLHEVASGALDASLDEVGYRGHAYNLSYRFHYGTLEAIDRDRREIVLAPVMDEDGTELMGRHRLAYDYLVLAVGSVSLDFGTPGVARHCIYLDQRDQADRFRLKLLNACLKIARMSRSPESVAPQLTVAIVGAGATGVELSAELYHAARAFSHYGLEDFDSRQLSITLIEAGPRILPMLSGRISAAVKEELERLGVRIHVGSEVTEVTPEGLILASGTTVAAALKVWAAGVKGPDFLREIGGLETTKRDRLAVLPTLATTRDERIFAIGDCAACPIDDGGRTVPPRAQSAHQMAAHLSRNLRNKLAGKPLKPYRYRDYGSLVNLSRYSTVGNLMGRLVGGSLKVEGRLARAVYNSLYRMHLVTVHGWVRAILAILVRRLNRAMRPRLKLH
jgi:NADH dehydrogenase